MVNRTLHLTQAQKVQIRLADPSDDQAVAELFGALHAYNAALDPRFALADDWERVLHEHLSYARARGRGLTLLAWLEEEPVGLLIMDGHTDSPLFRHRHWAELLALYVTPAMRGTRVAEQMLAAGIEWAQQRGYERVQLYVTASNLRAKRFYARAGFRAVQEIWRLELGPGSEAPRDDPACEAARARHRELLQTSQHHLASGNDNGAFFDLGIKR